MRAGVAALIVATAGADAAPSIDPRVADVVAAGAVRIALDVANPLLAARSPATLEYRGVTIGLANALAARIGVPARIRPFTDPPEIVDALRDRVLDVGFLAVDPARATAVDFSPGLIEVDSAYLVSPGSPVRNVGELDAAGVRIAVVKGYGADLFLTRALRRGTVVRSPGLEQALDIVITGQADAVAGHLPSLRALAPRLPGARLLVDRFIGETYAMAVPKGQRDLLAFVSEFVEEAKAAGFIQRGIQEFGLEGVRVARPAQGR